MRLIERVLQSVERSPDAPAFIASDQPITYRSLLALLSNVVRHLHGQGVRLEDKLTLFRKFEIRTAVSAGTR